MVRERSYNDTGEVNDLVSFCDGEGLGGVRVEDVGGLDHPDVGTGRVRDGSDEDDVVDGADAGRGSFD